MKPSYECPQEDGWDPQERDLYGQGKRRRRRLPSRLVGRFHDYTGAIRHVSLRNLGKKIRKRWERLTGK